MTFHEDFPEFFDYYPIAFKDKSPELLSFLKLHINALDWNYDEKGHLYNYNFLAFYFLYMCILFSYNFKKDYCELSFEDRKDKNIYNEYKKENLAFEIFKGVPNKKKIKDNILKPRNDFAHPNFINLDYDNFRLNIEDNIKTFNVLLDITHNDIVKCYESFLKEYNEENELKDEVEIYLVEQFYLSRIDFRIIVYYLRFKKMNLVKIEKEILEYLEENYCDYYMANSVDVYLYANKFDTSFYDFYDVQVRNNRGNIISEFQNNCAHIYHIEDKGWEVNFRNKIKSIVEGKKFNINDLDDYNIMIRDEYGNDVEELIH